MSDEELIARLRDLGDHAAFEPHMHHVAADRIEQLAATNEALVKERDEAIRRRDAWKSKAEGYDAVRKALREKVGAPWPPNLSRALWAGIAADEKKRADDAEAKLAKAVEALTPSGDTKAEYMGEFHFSQTMIGEDGDEVTVKTYVPWTTIKKIMAAINARANLAEIKGESHE